MEVNLITHPNADRVTLILHDPIYNIPAISWIKESEWEEAVLNDIFGIGFGVQFDPEFISSKKSSLVERFFNLHSVVVSKNFRERKVGQQWDQYLKWRLKFQNKNSKNLIPIPKKSKTAPLQIQGTQGNLIVLTTHDLTLSGSL